MTRVSEEIAKMATEFTDLAVFLGEDADGDIARDGKTDDFFSMVSAFAADWDVACKKAQTAHNDALKKARQESKKRLSVAAKPDGKLVDSLLGDLTGGAHFKRKLKQQQEALALGSTTGVVEH